MNTSSKQSHPELFLLIPGVLLIAFMHLWKLTSIPGGFNVDEIAIAYDAKCLAQFGVNRSGISYPFYLPNYGGSQAPLYTYSLVILFRLVGASKLSLRLVAAFYAFLGAFFGYRFAALVWPDSKKKYLWLYLYAIIPVFTMETRYAMDSHLLMSVSMIALYFAASALSRDRVRDYVAAGLAFGLCLYSYALAHFLVPVALLFLVIYRFRLKPFPFKKILAFVIPLFLLAIPHVCFQLVNLGILNDFQIWKFTFIKPSLARSSEFDFSHFWLGWISLFRFTLGFDHLNYCNLKLFGTMYYLSVPFILAGIGLSIRDVIRSFKNRECDPSAICLFWFFAIFLLSGAMSGDTEPNSSRMNAVFFTYLYFLIRGLDILRARCLKAAVAVAYTAFFGWFAIYYFGFYGNPGSVYLFHEDFSAVRAYTEAHADEGFVQDPFYYDCLFPYYLWSYDLTPGQYVMEGDWLGSYGKDRFSYPETLDLYGSYVMPVNNTGSILGLTQLGFEDIPLGAYDLMIGPFAGLTKWQTEDVLFSLDRTRDVENNYQFIGWCWDIVGQRSFSSYRMDFGTFQKEYGPTERTDVMDVLDYVTDPACGFEITFPMDVFRNQIKTCDLTIYGITPEGDAIALYRLSSALN